MKMFVGGQWVDKAKAIEVRNPYDNSVIDTVPKGDGGDVERALAFAERGAKVMGRLLAYERSKILRRAADLIAAHVEEVGRLVSTEHDDVGGGSQEDPRGDDPAGWRPEWREKAGFHPAGPVRCGGRHQPFQLSAQPGLP
jgi:hypothetical protein